MHMASIQVAAGMAKAGKLKALAVTSKTRSPTLPDVPTLAEAGVKTADVDLSFWYAIFGPRRMPAEVKAKLAKAVEKVMSDPKVRERLAKLDIEPAYAGADVLEKKLQSEIANWTKFIDAKGIKAE
jgi:tripartite-type tricarboxylate transporter receptor subunit TctC